VYNLSIIRDSDQLRHEATSAYFWRSVHSSCQAV